MASKFADLLRRERGARFSGREPELALFHQLLHEADAPFFLLFIYGPGGQGKTTLLEKYRERCAEQGFKAFSLDGRDLIPIPDTILAELNRQVSDTGASDFFSWLEKNTDQQIVLIVDNYELLQPVDNWLRREFLPQLTDNSRVVLSGRRAPSEGFVNDPGWKKLMRIIHLRNFDFAEARSFLTVRNLPEDLHERIFTVTHGHPLALSVVADTFDQQSGQDFNPEASSDVLRTLFERFVQEISSIRFRIALETSALVHYTTESLLQFVLNEEDVTEYFDWLRQRSFMEESKWGLAPSELAREAILAELRWRNPDRFAELHNKAGNYYKSKLAELRGEQQRSALFELVYLHRSNPVVRPFFNWEDLASYWMDAYQNSDAPAIQAMLTKHEGESSAANFAYWAKHSAAQIWVWRDGDRRAVAFVLRIDLDKIPAGESIADPAVVEMQTYQQQHLPLRSGEHMALFRSWMSEETYQSVSPVQSSMFLTIVQYYFTPGLAVSAFCCAYPEFWQPVLSYADLRHVAALDFTAGDKPQGWFLHDWRLRPPVDWLGLLAKREIDAQAGQETITEPAKSAILVLSEAEFEEAVSDALKNWHLTRDYDQNPLLRSNVVVRQVGIDEPASKRFSYLKNRLQSALEDLEASPLDNKYHRVLYRSFSTQWVVRSAQRNF